VVGTALLRRLPSHVHVQATVRSTPVTGAGPADLHDRAVVAPVELTDPTAVLQMVEQFRPDVVIHSAASVRSRADVVEATRSVAMAAASSGAALVHLSTDMVFDGEHAPFDESSPPAPVNDYGRWKLDAERIAHCEVPDVAVTRTSLVVSPSPPDRTSASLLEAVRSGSAPAMFVDEMRCPIHADDLAHRLWGLVGLGRAERAGVWHLPGPEVLSRHELARRLCRSAGLDPGAIRAASARDHHERRPRDLTLISNRPALVDRPLRAVP